MDDVATAFSLPAEKFRVKYGTTKPSEADTNVVFSCLGGVRSRMAMESVHEVGFPKYVSQN